MRSLFAIGLLLQLSIQGLAQGNSLMAKPSIDTSVLGKWPELGGGTLTPDGKYLSYVLTEHMPENRVTTVIQSPDGKWKTELRDVGSVKFSADSKSAFYLSHDTLHNIKLGTSGLTTVTGVQAYTLIPYSKGEWLVYQLKAPEKQLIVKNEKTEKEHRFKAVETYSFSKDGETMVLESKNEDEKENRVTWVDLNADKENIVWTGSGKLLQIVFDNSGKRLAFTTEENKNRSIWRYSKSSNAVDLVVRDGDAQIEKGLTIGSLDQVSKDGQYVFLYLERRYPLQPTKPNAANVNVWSYKDNMLQPEQIKRMQGKSEITKQLLSVINFSKKQLYQLQDKYCEVIDKSEEYTLLNRLNTDDETPVGQGESAWNSAKAESSFYLVSNINGSRIKLPWKYKDISGLQFSPEGKFIVFRQMPALHYFTYEISSGKIANITSKIVSNLTMDLCYKNEPEYEQKLLNIPGWLKNDSGVLIYDRNDIWLVDPLAKAPPECITNGYGIKNGLIFRLAVDEKFFYPGQKLILAALNQRTKENGHFIKILGQKGNPLLINMKLSLYAIGVNEGAEMAPNRLISALNKTAYIITQQTSSEFPNYYYTTDLKHFQQITFLNPEKKFNWMTTELHSWIAPDGDTLQGILYKPENFDSSKKYPIIFEIYRQFSNRLNGYLKPNWSLDRIDIPWFVSNGYLVFTPDIHYTVPKLKESVLNCVASAAKYVSKLPFVDAQKMGIQGHSFGGLEMGYVITGTDFFAAGSSAAGSFDLISDAGSILPPPSSVPRQGIWERDFIYGTLWEKKDLYLDNSPIFDVDKVKTPFLMVGGELDNTKPYDQNIEFFLGLRRLSKPSWFLTYPEERHSIFWKKDYVDYTIRITQFFDHYLKEMAAPTWMTTGIPARLKGAENGYALDFKGICTPECKICQKLSQTTKR